MSALSESELAELREKAEKATPGEWKWGWRADALVPGSVYTIGFSANNAIAMYPRYRGKDSGGDWSRDAAHIAAFNPQTALRLLSDLAREREARREGERLLKVFADHAEDWDVWPDKTGLPMCEGLTVGDLRAAHAFLASADPKARGNEKLQQEKSE